jgi:hypothetical protein
MMHSSGNVKYNNILMYLVNAFSKSYISSSLWKQTTDTVKVAVSQTFSVLLLQSIEWT